MPLSQKIARLADMSGRTVAITGGLGHLGLLMAEVLGSAGADVILIDLESVPEPMDRLEAIRASGAAGCEVIAGDLGDPVSLEKLIARIAERCPRLDVLINNAALVGDSATEGWATSFPTQSLDMWRTALDINLTAPFRLIQGLLPQMQNGASVINISSIYGIVGPDWGLYEGTTMGNPAAYAASKGGLGQLTRYLATTLAPKIRVNTIAPGGIERGQAPEFQARYVARAPLRRMANLDDFAGVTLFLASDLSAYVTGQTIAVDGGWTAW